MNKFDIFGQNITLNLNTEDNYRTAVGGIISIFILTILAVFFQSNILSFLEKTNIISETSTEFSTDPDEITFNDYNFIVAIGI